MERVIKPRTKKAICTYGHVIAVCGRRSDGVCGQCAKDRNHLPSVINWHYRKQGIHNLDGTSFTTIDFDRAYQIQQGRCAICKKHQSELKRRLNADHDHKTNVFRGLLCSHCNVRLETIDNKEFNERARQYLKGL